MKKNILDILPKLSQWQNTPYVPDFSCPDCGRSALLGKECCCLAESKPNLIGWCETPNGYMMVFECPICFAKYRFHCNTGNKLDKKNFEISVLDIIETDSAIENYKELYNKLINENQ